VPQVGGRFAATNMDRVFDIAMDVVFSGAGLFLLYVVLSLIRGV
jgi:hypothetical protein